MQVVSVDSEELVGEDGAADNVLDGQPDTFGHTEWSSSSPAHPHELVIWLGRGYCVGGFRYLPQQDGCMRGERLHRSRVQSHGGFTLGILYLVGKFLKAR